jgi:hypothetical protein
MRSKISTALPPSSLPPRPLADVAAPKRRASPNLDRRWELAAFRHFADMLRMKRYDGTEFGKENESVVIEGCTAGQCIFRVRVHNVPSQWRILALDGELWMICFLNGGQ